MAMNNMNRKRLNSVMSVDILLFHKVKLSDGSEGIVRYIGGIMGKKGVFYGIDLTKGDAKNNGTFEGIEYFKTKKGTFTGIFVLSSKIKKWSKTKHSKYPCKLNETVFCKKTNCNGVIKYIGIPSWSKNNKMVYYGLELKEKKGNTNGMMKGTAYFKTKKYFGVYVPYTDITQIRKNKKNIKNDKNKKDIKKKKKKNKKNKKKKNKLKVEYNDYNEYEDDDSLESNDDDIDVDYDWSVSVKSKKPNKLQLADDDDDDDIDIEYNWMTNCIEEFDDDDAFDLVLLDIPIYHTDDDDDDDGDGDGDHGHNQNGEPLRYSGIFKLNIANNEYDENKHEIDSEHPESPVSVLSAIESSESIHIPSFKPSQSALSTFAVIVENVNDENDEIDQDLKQIDDALGEYYKSLGHLDDFNNGDDGKSIFIKYCEDKCISYIDIDKYFNKESIEDYKYLQFDKNFPLKLSNDIDIDDSIDIYTKQQTKIIEMHTMIKYCYENKSSPY